MMAREKPLTRISDILLKIAKKFDLEIKIVEQTINKNWGKLVGERISAHTKPDTVSYRKLLVHVDSPAWMQQLMFLKEDIIKNINEAAGRKIVKDIRFQIGDVTKEVETPSEKDSENKGEFRPLTKNDLAFADEVIRPIEDEKTKGKARKAVIKYLTAKNKK
jgi:hypothetical protein